MCCKKKIIRQNKRNTLTIAVRVYFGKTSLKGIFRLI